MKKQTAAENFFESLKNDPEKIIEWAQNEIEQYKKLIKLIKLIKYESKRMSALRKARKK